MKTLILSAFCLIQFAFLQAQNLPDYKERDFSLLKDSLDIRKDFLPEATEGSVDPEEYLVGPGDKIFISISGIEDIASNLFVNQEGILFVPKVGGVDLNNTSLAKAKEKISSAINKYYKNVDVFISLVDFRKIKVSLLGDVKKPSTYILPGNARLVDLVMNSSGLNETSDYRNIKIIGRETNYSQQAGSVNKERKDTSYFDLLSFIRFGKRSENPILKEGDIVIIDKVDKLVSIHGQIKYSGMYEFVEGETVLEFIELAGGFLNKAKRDTIELVRFSQDGRTQSSYYYPISDLKINDIKLNTFDRILVREIPEYYIEKFVRIDGFVNYPGYYKIVENKTTIKDVILEAGGFRKNASLFESSLTRNTGIEVFDPEFERLKLIPRAELSDEEYDYLKAKSRQRKGRVIVDFYKLFNSENNDENVILKPNDFIEVPEAKNYIILLGQVVSPGNIIYQKGLSVDDYINLAGGFGWRAEEGDVRVIKANTGEWIDPEDVDSLEPGDTIWIPEEPPPARFWDVFTTSLTIFGQVASIVAAMVAVIIATR